MAGKKKEPFDIATERDTFFEARDVIGRNPGKSHVYEIPPSFDSSLEVGPSRKYGTLQNIFESCFSLARYPDALTEIENILYQSGKEQKDSTMNSLHKKKDRQRHVHEHSNWGL